MFENLGDERFGQIKSKIDRIIHEDTYYQKGALNMRTQKCFAVKPNLNGLLDVARRTYSEMVDDVAETIKKLAQKYNLPLKTGFTASRGFYIIISMKAIPELPSVFVKVQKQKNGVSCTTGDLIKLNDRITESLNDIYLMTNEVTKGLLQEIYPLVGCLYKLSECCSMLDMITSFAAVSAISDYSRPEFTDTLALKDSVHPILGKIDSVLAISNDVFASSASSFNIVTGPNMSGKSTYIKQIALLQVMAQVGCFVPASYASLRLTDNIFSRIGCDDDIETNASTFTLEMREIKYILDNITDRSLVIIDELGRGTGVEEGAALCFAISEHIIARTKSFVFFVTHFQELHHLEKIYPNVANYHFQVNYELAPGSDKEKVQFLRKLSKGSGPHQNYGIKLAKLSALPDSVKEEAVVLAEELRNKCGYSQPRERSDREVQEHNVYSLAEHIRQSVKHRIGDKQELKKYLKNLQKECGVTEDTPRNESNETRNSLNLTASKDDRTISTNSDISRTDSSSREISFTEGEGSGPTKKDTARVPSSSPTFRLISGGSGPGSERLFSVGYSAAATSRDFETSRDSDTSSRSRPRGERRNDFSDLFHGTGGNAAAASTSNFNGYFNKSQTWLSSGKAKRTNQLFNTKHTDFQNETVHHRPPRNPQDFNNLRDYQEGLFKVQYSTSRGESSFEDGKTSAEDNMSKLFTSSSSSSAKFYDGLTVKRRFS